MTVLRMDGVKMQLLACVVQGIELNPLNREEEIRESPSAEESLVPIHFSELKHTVTAKHPHVVRAGLCKKSKPLIPSKTVGEVLKQKEMWFAQQKTKLEYCLECSEYRLKHL